MPHLFGICRMVGGDPDLDRTVTPFHGFVHCASIGNFGAYLFSGTGAQLTALAALPVAQFVPIVAITKSGDVRWAELDGVITTAIRNKLNTWLTARSLPNIPVGWTYKQVVVAIFKRLHANFDLDNFYVVAPEDATMQGMAEIASTEPSYSSTVETGGDSGAAGASDSAKPKRKRRSR